MLTLHMLEDQWPSWIFLSFMNKMPKSKKTEDSVDKVPNYSRYDYTDKLQTFTEADHLLESELSLLECYGEYELEAPQNNFSDRI